MIERRLQVDYEPGAAQDRVSGSRVSGQICLRSPLTTECGLVLIVLATLPAFVLHAHRVGGSGLSSDAWRLTALEFLGLSGNFDGLFSRLASGILQLLPMLVVCGLVSLAWVSIFARLRKRPLEPAWFATAWLFVLLVPAELPWPLAAIGISFALVMGLLVFGGSGYYLVSPAVLGALFIDFSYPGAGGTSIASTWSGASLNTDPFSIVAVDWSMLIVCLLGAGILLRAGIASASTLAGAVVGVTATWAIAQSTGQLPSLLLQLSLGALPVSLVFLLTDPTAQALTARGRLFHGLLFGVIVVGVRTLDPGHPEASLLAVLLASLLVPLLDYLVVRRHVARLGGRLRVQR